MESLKSIVVDKVKEMKCQLTAQIAENANLKSSMSILQSCFHLSFVKPKSK